MKKRSYYAIYIAIAFAAAAAGLTACGARTTQGISWDPEIRIQTGANAEDAGPQKTAPPIPAK